MKLAAMTLAVTFLTVTVLAAFPTAGLADTGAEGWALRLTDGVAAGGTSVPTTARGAVGQEGWTAANNGCNPRVSRC